MVTLTLVPSFSTPAGGQWGGPPPRRLASAEVSSRGTGVFPCYPGIRIRQLEEEQTCCSVAFPPSRSVRHSQLLLLEKRGPWALCHRDARRADGLELRGSEWRLEGFSSRKVCHRGEMRKRWGKPITRGKCAELASEGWLVIKVRREIVFWALAPRRWACQWLQRSDGIGPAWQRRLRVSASGSLRLLEVLEKAQTRACRNLNASTLIY